MNTNIPSTEHQIKSLSRSNISSIYVTTIKKSELKIS